MNRSPALLDASNQAAARQAVSARAPRSASIESAPARRRKWTPLVFRTTARDAWPLAAAIAQGLLAAAAVPLALDFGLPGAALAAGYLGVSLWWCSNTVAHIHLHRPLFRSRLQNAALSLFLSAVLGVPQALWRARHLAHHAGDDRPRRWLGRRGAAEVAVIAVVWGLLFMLAPRFFVLAYMPGYALGMVLCALQGRYEHRREGASCALGVSYYGRLYNLVWFNDGYHAEHHASPGAHWTSLPARRGRRLGASPSGLPPVLRWIEEARPPSLDGAALAARGLRALASALSGCVSEALGILERPVLRLAGLQSFVIGRHERALRALLPALRGRRLERVGVVGGGLFPRTVLILRKLLPESHLVVVDRSAQNIERARRYLARHDGERGERGVQFVEASFDPRAPHDFDLIIIPLAFHGDREALYSRGNAAPVFIHDWIWRQRGDRGAVVSLFLLKRLNLVWKAETP
jgi:fatty acid desaturase